MTTADLRPDTEAAYTAARKRAEDIQGLYIHLMIYAVVNVALFVLNLVTRTEGDGWWFIWPLFGWGIGVVIHLVVTVAPVFTSDWVERRTQRILDRR